MMLIRRLPDEFSLSQWIRRPKRLARRRLVCECGQNSRGHDLGFRCRGPGSCGRYCCACVGGSDVVGETLCSKCWLKASKGGGK